MHTGEELKREEQLKILDREGSREKDPIYKQKN